MGNPAANLSSKTNGIDTHIVMVPAGPSLVPIPMPHPFMGSMLSGLSTDVMVGGQPAATLDSKSQNLPPHLPTPPGVSFQSPPSNQGSVMLASNTVMINGKPAARMGDKIINCNDPTDLPSGQIITGAVNVIIG